MKTTTMLTTIFLSLALVNCAKQASTDVQSAADASSSGVVAGAVGGALSDSSASGTQASYQFKSEPSRFQALKALLSPLPAAYASTFCPTFRTAGSGCQTSGGDMWLSYNNCTYTGRVTWTGVQDISMSAGSAACGTFPNPGANQILYRRFVTAAGGSTAGSVTLASERLTATIDDSVANLGNFDSQTIATLNPNGGYGTKVTFNSSGARSGLAFGHRIQINSLLDHSVSGSLVISEASSAAGSRTLNGTVTVYHNLMHVIGTSTLTNVVHSDVCCLPMSGTISTVYSDGQNVHAGPLGQLLIGKTETLTFTGCGTATFTSTDGSTANVTLNRCF